MEDDLRKAGLYHSDPWTDWLAPFFLLHELTPEEVLEQCAWREAYLARYGRISPSEIRDLDSEHVGRLITAVSELIREEYKARSATLDPMTEDSAG